MWSKITISYVRSLIAASLQVEVTEIRQGKSTTNVIRACVSTVPDDCDGIEIDEMNDAIWGVDGMDIWRTLNHSVSVLYSPNCNAIES